MKTNTFILIVTVYSLLLGIPALFAPSLSLEYFHAHPDSVHEQAFVNFLGGYQIAMGYWGYIAYQSTDKNTRKGWLLAVVFLTLLAIVIYGFNVYVRKIEFYNTMAIDLTIWLLIALGALFFISKEN